MSFFMSPGSHHKRHRGGHYNFVRRCVLIFHIIITLITHVDSGRRQHKSVQTSRTRPSSHCWLWGTRPSWQLARSLPKSTFTQDSSAWRTPSLECPCLSVCAFDWRVKPALMLGRVMNACTCEFFSRYWWQWGFPNVFNCTLGIGII